MHCNSYSTGIRRFSIKRKEYLGMFAYLFQRHARSVIHDSEMLLIVIQIIKREGPEEENNPSVPKAPHPSKGRAWGEAAPVGEAQPEDVVAVEPQGPRRAQQHHVAHVELHLPHVLALKQHRVLDVFAHHLQQGTANTDGTLLYTTTLTSEG